MLQELAVVFPAEFIRRIRSRPFIIGTILGVAMVFLIAVLPSFFERSIVSASKRLVVAAPADLTTPALVLLRRDDTFVVTQSVGPQEIPRPPTVAFLQAHGNAAALLVLTRGKHGLDVSAYARDAGTFAAGRISRDLAPLAVAVAGGLPTNRIITYSPRAIEVHGVEGRYTTSESADVARGIATFLVTILYIVVLVNSQLLTSSVAEEKTSRIAELLVATISPSSLLAGKVLATGSAGLLQIAVWSAAGIAVAGNLTTGSSGAPSAETLIALAEALTPSIVVAFLASFVLGFLEYSLLFAGAASLISRTEDLGSITVPLVLPVLAAFMIAQFAMAAPESPTVVIASFVPLLSPFVMFTRMLIVTVPAWQVAVAFALNVAALSLIVPFSGKLYRVGLLLYGRTPKLAQIWAVLRS